MSPEFTPRWKQDVMKSIHDTGGFTLKDQIGDAPTEGYMVGVPGHEEETPSDLVSGENQADYVKREWDFTHSHPDMYSGGWDDEHTFYNDVSKNDKGLWDAVKDAYDNDQISFYDLKNHTAPETQGFEYDGEPGYWIAKRAAYGPGMVARGFRATLTLDKTQAQAIHEHRMPASELVRLVVQGGGADDVGVWWGSYDSLGMEDNQSYAESGYDGTVSVDALFEESYYGEPPDIETSNGPFYVDMPVIMIGKAPIQEGKPWEPNDFMERDDAYSVPSGTPIELVEIMYMTGMDGYTSLPANGITVRA